MEGQREKARAKSTFQGAAAEEFELSDPMRESLRRSGDIFEGYSTTILQDVPVLALFDQKRRQVDALPEAAAGFAVLARSPFYVEAGGQVSDEGWLEGPGGRRSRVSGVVRIGAGLPRAHRIERLEGPLRTGDVVTVEVDAQLRDATRRNHTGTHLLHAALRKVLGPHVKQAGSLVAPDRLRFDFVHFNALTASEIQAIERTVNEEIVRNSPVNTAERRTEEAIAAGAMALFGEKYGETVRVVSIGDGRFSQELCGGTHVRATGDIGAFVITEESGVAAGVRRVEALTGLGASAFLRAELDELREARAESNAKRGELATWIGGHRALLSKAQKEVQQLKTRLALGGSGRQAEDDRVELNGATLITRQVDDVDKASLRSLADDLKSKLTSGIVFLAGATGDGKVTIIAAVTPDLTRKAPAGQLVKQLAPIVGGGGGGRPDFAEAGGKDPSKIAEMLAEGRKLVQRLLTEGSDADNRSRE
jgi:alanyl-tRNA synthetase